MQFQPYRKGELRPPGQALDAMQRGRTMGGWNPQDIARGSMPGQPAPKRSRRPPRPSRGKRPPRPPR